MSELFDVLTKDGDFANTIASREECHKKGLWHKAVVVFIISEDNERVLLQRRSANKKLWPNLWDITAGGHVLSGELGYQAVIRETKEEIGLTIDKGSLEFIGSTIFENLSNDIINRHFNEYYVVHKDVNLKDIVLQEEEVQDIRWFTKQEIIDRVKNNYEDLTDKVSCWNYLIKYFELTK
ncbi:MAG: NUDIX domain-containing protein [Bacilli bacterium]|nr:NUDIX domain-containing protein [Bacilli bacterium]